MNNNQEVIEQIKEQSAPFMERLTDRATREFRLKDLDINEHGLFFKDMPITSTARTKVLGMLRVKKNFSEFANKMTPEDWRSVSAKLKNAEGDTKLYGQFQKMIMGIRKSLMHTLTEMVKNILMMLLTNNISIGLKIHLVNLKRTIH